MKNTPEPWQIAPAFITDATGHPVALVEYGKDYAQDQEVRERIVACVNACAGMNDPAKEIAELRVTNARFKNELREMLPVLEADGLTTTARWVRYLIGEASL